MKSKTEKRKQMMTVSISGMHCRSCEMLVEEKLTEIPEVTKAEVKYKRGTADIHYDSRRPNDGDIEAAIREAGYSIGTEGKKPILSRNSADYKDLGIALLLVLMLSVLLSKFELRNLSFVPSSSGSATPAVIFLVGLTAGLSTCMALVGGLVLGISARHAEKHPEATVLQKFRPHLFFNFGRIVSYAVLGGMLGVLGSIFSLAGAPLGILTIIIGLVMFLLGLKLVGIFPRLEATNVTLPKSVSRIFGVKHGNREYSHRNAALLGAFTFFLPCGFTQAMQLLAIGSGSFVGGAFIMGLFALGTTPGLLGIGGLASAVKGIFAQRFFKFAGVVVILFAIFNISNGLTVIGWRSANVPTSSLETTIDTKGSPQANVRETGVQIVRMTQDGSGYHPRTFSVEKGRPVRLIVTSSNPYSCASSMIIPKMSVQKNLTSGENIIEFTPTESGTIPFSCSMGMYSGSIIVR